MFGLKKLVLGASLALTGTMAMAAADGMPPLATGDNEPFPVPGYVTVVDFGAEWCATCPEMVQVFKDLQKKYGHLAKFVIIDIDDYQDIEKKYVLEQLPSQIFFDKTGEPIWEHVGVATAEQILERVDFLNARDMDGNEIENPPSHLDKDLGVAKARAMNAHLKKPAAKKNAAEVK